MNAKQLGTIFAEISIDDAARAAVNAARLWGGQVIVTVDDDNRCTARAPDMTDTDRYLRECPWAMVGAYDVTSNSAESRRKIAVHIAEDIWEHVRLKSSARVAA